MSRLTYSAGQIVKSLEQTSDFKTKQFGGCERIRECKKQMQILDHFRPRLRLLKLLKF